MISISDAYELSGWEFQVPYGINVVEAVTMAINSSMGIPRVVPSKRYLPSVSGYELDCDRFDLFAPTRKISVLPNNGCASITLAHLNFNYSSNVSRMYIIPGSNGRIKVVVSVPGESASKILSAETVVSTSVEQAGEICVLRSPVFAVVDASYSGITSFPRVSLTKCLFQSGKTVVVSSSVIRFSVTRNEMFHSLSTSIFGTQNELVLAMQESVNNSTLTTFPANVPEELVIMEVKVTGTKVESLTCQWERLLNTQVTILCSYQVANALVTQPQPMDPKISQRLVNKGRNSAETSVVGVATFSYLPQYSNGSLSFGIPKILDEAASVADYFASLGNNFVVDWDASMLYIIFDTFDIVNGYEVPGWVFLSIVGLYGFCLVYLGITERVLEARYRDSAFKTISREILGGQDSAKPRLHRFDPKTLMFEGSRPLVVCKPQLDVHKDVSVSRSPTRSSSHDQLSAAI
ncbi:hypothetical protein BGZ73_004444 [Actinomortierella ambigua]|nr:hypothetical protein BGZ73_004444 [Actinomortierella ambigua]